MKRWCASLILFVLMLGAGCVQSDISNSIESDQLVVDSIPVSSSPDPMPMIEEGEDWVQTALGAVYIPEGYRIQEEKRETFHSVYRFMKIGDDTAVMVVELSPYVDDIGWPETRLADPRWLQSADQRFWFTADETNAYMQSTVSGWLYHMSWSQPEDEGFVEILERLLYYPTNAQQEHIRALRADEISPVAQPVSFIFPVFHRIFT